MEVSSSLKIYLIYKNLFRNRSVKFPQDNRLKVYFVGKSEGEPRRLMQIIQISFPLLASIQLELEYRGHKVFSFFFSFLVI